MCQQIEKIAQCRSIRALIIFGNITSNLLISVTILESGGAKIRSSLQRSVYSSSASPSSSKRILEELTMEEERRLVLLLPLEELNSDMGDIQEERPEKGDEMGFLE